MRKMRDALGISVCALVLVLVASIGAAAAQGFFYQEVEKDGRIYVFNDMKAYESFAKTGEMGKSITRIGAGPNGETVIFDSEEAIHLYNFKHGRPGEVIRKEEPKTPVMKVSWKDGKTTIDTDKASLSLSNRVQIRFTQNDPGDPTKGSKGSFRIRRAKTKFEGWIYDKNLTYELQINWADTGSSLEDANVAFDATNGQKLFQIKAGQFKAPFGRQELTSSGKQQFVDRSIVSSEFAKGRDIGVQLYGMPLAGKLEWYAGIFNGNGRNKTSNDNGRYQYDARLNWQPFGDVKYSESDFESRNEPLFSIAADYEQNNLQGSTSGNDPDCSTVGVDSTFKFKGVSVFAEYFTKTSDLEMPADLNGDGTVAESSFDSDGFHAQVGVFVVPGTVELAARYATLDPNNRVDHDDLTETGLAVNWFINKHNLKLQADFRRTKDDSKPSGSDTDKEGRLQFQFIF